MYDISILDLLFLIITIFYMIKCYYKGFVLSLLSLSRWLLAYVATLFLFPTIKPFFKKMMNNEYLLDVILGLTIFISVIFIISITSRVISKTVKFVGLGSLDSFFGLFFGFIKSYIICVCLFTVVDVLYNYNKWPININKSYTFPYLQKGSIYLIKVIPDEKKYQNSKKKIEAL
jgi:membrane protein required for colicin V production